MNFVLIPKLNSTLCINDINTKNTTEKQDYILFLDFLFNFSIHNITFTVKSTTKIKDVIFFSHNQYCINKEIYGFNIYKKAIQYLLNEFTRYHIDTKIILSNNLINNFFELLIIQSKSKDGIKIYKEYLPKNIHTICEYLKDYNIFTKNEYKSSIVYLYNNNSSTNTISLIESKFTIQYDEKIVYKDIPIQYPTLQKNYYIDNSKIELHNIFSKVHIPTSLVPYTTKQEITLKENIPQGRQIRTNYINTKSIIENIFYCIIEKQYQNHCYSINYNRVWLLPSRLSIHHMRDKYTLELLKSYISKYDHFTYEYTNFTFCIEPFSEYFTINSKNNIKLKYTVDNLQLSNQNYLNNKYRNTIKTSINNLINEHINNNLSIRIIATHPNYVERTNKFIIQGNEIDSGISYTLNNYYVGMRLKNPITNINVFEILEELDNNRYKLYEMIRQNKTKIISPLDESNSFDYNILLPYIELFITNNEKVFDIDIDSYKSSDTYANQQFKVVDCNTRLKDILGANISRYGNLVNSTIKDCMNVFIDKEKLKNIVDLISYKDNYFIIEINILEFLFIYKIITTK